MYRVLLLAVSLLDAIISLGFARVLVYETSMSSMTQYAHCVYVVGESTVKYCWRGTSVQVFETSSDDPRCFNGGQQWIFRDLKAANVSPSKVVSWSSGVERADDYAAYVYDGRSDLAMTSLCECLSAGTFGARCEFKLLDRSQTFDNAVESQFNDKRNDFAAMQRYGDILCYRPLFLCDSGLLCLDWRDVCDGQQQCMDGLDEENCDFIEFNECEENEYRCVNGFCIDQEYWLDGESEILWNDDGLDPLLSLSQVNRIVWIGRTRRVLITAKSVQVKRAASSVRTGCVSDSYGPVAMDNAFPVKNGSDEKSEVESVVTICASSITYVRRIPIFNYGRNRMDYVGTNQNTRIHSIPCRTVSNIASIYSDVCSRMDSNIIVPVIVPIAPP